MKRGVIVGVVAVVIASTGLFAFLLAPKGPPIREFTIDMVEHVFIQGQEYNPTLRVKVGDTVVIKLTNRGVVAHHFMIIEDVETVIAVLRGVLRELHASGAPDEVIVEHYKHKLHELEASDSIRVAFGVHVDLEPGAGDSVSFTATRPGVFTYVCLIADGTYPDTHYDKGMYGTIIVEP